MKRRKFILLLGGVLGWPLAARAQTKIPLIGVLNPGSSDPPGAPAFYEGMRQLGYIEGQNIVFDRRYGQWNADRFYDLAVDLVRAKPDVVVVMSTSPARAAKQATSTTPIVVGSMADPVGDELVASLARPGGNLTGNTFIGPELIGKRFGLLRDVVPGLSRVAALLQPNAYGSRTMSVMVKETETAAQALGLKLELVPAAVPGDIDGAFATMARARSQGLVVLPSPMLYGEHKHIVELAARNRLPAIYAAREFVDDGGLMSYGANLTELFRRVSVYVDKILKGASPADLPVEQPTKLELVVNAKTAKELGLDLSREFILLADEIIE